MNLKDDEKKKISGIEFREVPKPPVYASPPTDLDDKDSLIKVRDTVQKMRQPDTTRDGTIQCELTSINILNGSSLYSNTDNLTFLAGGT